MSILFERKVESSDALSPGHARIATGVPRDTEAEPERDAGVQQGAGIDTSMGLEVRVDHRVDQLEDEVDHLRVCIDQLLDMVDSQFDSTDELDLLSDRMSLFERRMQRVEVGVSSVHRAKKRRAGEQ